MLNNIDESSISDVSPLVSVIVPTLNEVANIEACLESIKTQNYKNIEIIVGDSHSTDGTVEIAEKYAKVVFAPKGSPAKGRNTGAKVAKGDILAFVDADTTVPADWIGKFVSRFSSDPKCIGVGGIIMPQGGNIFEKIFFYFIIFPFMVFLPHVRIYFYAGCNCAYRRDAFLSAGGFNESLSMFEDSDLSLRLGFSGVLKFDPSQVVFTSTRRLRQKGTAHFIMQYGKAIFSEILNQPVKEKYFDSITHQKTEN